MTQDYTNSNLDYKSCLHPNLFEGEDNIRLCRGCGVMFLPKDFSATNALSFRCEKCLTIKSLLRDAICSCVIS